MKAWIVRTWRTLLRRRQDAQPERTRHWQHTGSFEPWDGYREGKR